MKFDAYLVRSNVSYEISTQIAGGLPNWYQNISDGVNGGGFAAAGLTYRAGKVLEKASRYHTSVGNSLNFWSGAKPTAHIKVPFTRGFNVSARTLAGVGNTFKTIGTTAGVIGGTMIVGDVLYNSQVNASHVVNSFMTGIAFTGWGAPVAAVWFVADTGFAYFTDASLSQRIDSAVGGPLVDWEW